MVNYAQMTTWENKDAWDGLGTDIGKRTSVKDMLKAAKMDWKVTREPITVGGKELEGFAALVRSDNKHVFDIAGSRYIPAQNADVFEFFQEFVEEGKAKIEVIGGLNNGGIVWALASLGVDFELPGQDKVSSHLLMATHHKQGKSNIVKLINRRFLCGNTLALALSGKGTEFRMNHRSEFNASVIKRGKEVLGLARDQAGDFERNARLLKKLKLSPKDVLSKLFGPMYQPQTDVKELLADFDGLASSALHRVTDAYKNAPGADPGTGWGALNACSYVSDHLASRSPNKRLQNAWLGKTARQKEHALNTLLEMV